MNKTNYLIFKLNAVKLKAIVKKLLWSYRQKVQKLNTYVLEKVLWHWLVVMK